jgi:hypothetical protein
LTSIVLAAALAFTLCFKLPECCIVDVGPPLTHIYHVIKGDDRRP